MKVLDPPVLFDPQPIPFSAGTFCSHDGRWEQVLACNICRSTTVHYLGVPAWELDGFKECGCPTFGAKLYFECDQGHVFTLAFRNRDVKIWLGCIWANNLLESEAVEDGEEEFDPHTHAR